MQRIILTKEQFSKLVSGELLSFAPLQGESITVYLESGLSFGEMLNAIQEAIENGNIHDDASADENMAETEPEPEVMEPVFEEGCDEPENPSDPIQET